MVVGLIFLCTVMVFTFLGRLKQEHAERVDVLSLYWHFVDAVWSWYLSSFTLSVAKKQLVKRKENGCGRSDGDTREYTERSESSRADCVANRLAFGTALFFAGFVTSASVSLLGAVLFVSGCIGWFRDMFLHEQHEAVPVVESFISITTTRPEVAQVELITHEVNRSRLPLEIYPVSAGVKGGFAGCVAMAILAEVYGIVSGHGIWYPINLLSAGFFPEQIPLQASLLFIWMRC